MKKFLLVLSCFVFAVCAKAAEYEIATAFSSPYGMFSTFSVFGNSAVYDLIIGANSVDGVDNVYKPVQETYAEVDGTVSFGGNLSVKRDLYLGAPNQTYGNVLVSKYSSGTVQRDTFFDMAFDSIEIPMLYASKLITGSLKLTSAAFINNLYAMEFKVNNFIFPQVRSLNNGDAISQETPSSQCGSGNLGHSYDAWTTCTGSSCPSDTCNGNTTDAYTCSDPKENDKAKSCTDVRTVSYGLGNVSGYTPKPYISVVKLYYRKCVYNSNAEDTADMCALENYASGEEIFINDNVDGIARCDGMNSNNTCIDLCNLYSGGCADSARECVKIDPKSFGADNCEASGWEKGSGLECKDSYKRVFYTIYTCPQGSDYANRPAASTVKQYRNVYCAMKYADADTTSTYCDTKFLTVGF